MNIHEYQAAEMLARYGIPTNPGTVATSPAEAEQAAQAVGGLVVVKAQVHSGGRGKAGGVKLAKTPADARAAAEQILGLDIRGHTVHKVLIAPGVSIAREFYLGVVLDRPQRQLVVMASAEGGVEIEIVAKDHPEKIKTAHIDPFLGLHAYQARQLGFELGLEPDKIAGFVDIVLKLTNLYLEQDATLAEVNPLILTTDGVWLALDSKVSFDDNALFRHPEFEALRDMNEEQATELEARRFGISFVKLDGNIGCIVDDRIGNGDDGRGQTAWRRAGEFPRCWRRGECGSSREGLQPGHG